MKNRNKFLILIFVIITACCSCPFLAIAVHDFAPHEWSSRLSRIISSDELRSEILKELSIRSSNRGDVIEYLREENIIDNCSSHDMEINCWIPFRDPVINPENHWDLRWPNLFFSGEGHHVRFSFDEDILTAVDVSTHYVGL